MNPWADDAVIYNVTLTTGKTLRGRFAEHPLLKQEERWWTLDTDPLNNTDPGEYDPNRWVYLNQEHIVSVEIWWSD